MSKQGKVQFILTVNSKKLEKQAAKASGFRSQLARVLFHLGAKVLEKKITVEYDVKQIKK